MPKKPTTAPTDSQVKARVLTQCQFGEANDVVLLSADEATLAQAAGIADSNPDAVAYAESLIA